MTQEDKELLLRDLSARLPYGVIVNYKEDKYDFHKWKIATLHAPEYSQSGSLINTDSDGWIEYNEYKGCGMSSGSRPLHLEITLPYLRPMSSITEEESKELGDLPATIEDVCETLPNIPYYIEVARPEQLDWLNSHHFDYRGLIEKGLALEAPKGMYK